MFYKSAPITLNSTHYHFWLAKFASMPLNLLELDVLFYKLMTISEHLALSQLDRVAIASI